MMTRRQSNQRHLKCGIKTLQAPALHLGVLQSLRPLQSHEVDVVGGVDGAGCAVDAVRHRNPPAQDTPVLDVVNSANGRK